MLGTRSMPSSHVTTTSARSAPPTSTSCTEDSTASGSTPEAEGEAGLRVEVDEQHPAALLRERGTERGDGGGLGDPALLVGEGDDRGLALRRHRGAFPGVRGSGPDSVTTEVRRWAAPSARTKRRKASAEGSSGRPATHARPTSRCASASVSGSRRVRANVVGAGQTHRRHDGHAQPGGGQPAHGGQVVGLERDLGLEAGRLAQREGLGAHARGRPAHDEGLVGDLGERRPRRARPAGASWRRRARAARRGCGATRCRDRSPAGR